MIHHLFISRALLPRLGWLLAVGAGLLSSASAAPPIPTEEEIVKAETQAEAFQPADLARAAMLQYPLQFVLQFEATPVAQAALVEPPASTVGSDLAVAVQVVRATQIGLPASVHNAAGNNLLVAGIAFDVLSWLTRDTSDRDRLRKQWHQMRYPSFFLVSLRKAEPSVADKELIDQRFEEVVNLLAKLQLGCEPAHFKATTFGGEFITRGAYWPGIAHERRYLCGYPGQVDVGSYTTVVGQRSVIAHKLGAGEKPSEYDGGTYAIINLHTLTDLKPVLKALDPEGAVDPEALPQLLFDRLRQQLPDSWRAVYTSLGPEGKRQMVVASGERALAFALPPRP